VVLSSWAVGEVAEPKPVVDQYEGTGSEEYGIGKFDDWEASKVQRVDEVGGDAEDGEEGRKFVHHEEE
jgi:hypothetical protein